jgi:uncharacterized protein (TIGR02246 family)
VTHDLPRAIEAASCAVRDAFAAGDATAMAAAYTTDAWLLAPNVDPVRGREAVRAFWQATMDAGAAVRSETIEVAALGDAARELGRYEMAMGGAGDTVAETGKYLLVWRLEGGAWKIAVDVWNAGGVTPEGVAR